MTIPHETDYKRIGLAAAGAAMLGMNLNEALLCLEIPVPTEYKMAILAISTPQPTASKKSEREAEKEWQRQQAWKAWEEGIKPRPVEVHSLGSAPLPETDVPQIDPANSILFR